MERITRNECSFSELFEFAEKKFKVDWNSCNQLFFHTILTWRSYNDFELEEVNHDIGYNKTHYAESEAKRIEALEILAAFMEANKVNSCRVLNT